MPVWNEGAVIEPAVRIMHALLDFSHELIFVVDDPNDDSAPVVEQLRIEFPNVRLVHNRIGRGVGNAVREGIDASRGEYVLIFPADDVGPALTIHGAIDLLEEGCDLVSGTRYAHGGRRFGGSAIQGVISRAGNRLFQWVSGSAFSDGTTCFKAFRKSILNELELESSGWEIMYELSIKVQVAGGSLGEIPITSIDRLYGGTSSFVLLPWLRRYWRWFWWGVLKFRGRRGPRPRVKLHAGVREKR